MLEQFSLLQKLRKGQDLDYVTQEKQLSVTDEGAFAPGEEEGVAEEQISPNAGGKGMSFRATPTKGAKKFGVFGFRSNIEKQRYGVVYIVYI